MKKINLKKKTNLHTSGWVLMKRRLKKSSRFFFCGWFISFFIKWQVHVQVLHFVFFFQYIFFLIYKKDSSCCNCFCQHFFIIVFVFWSGYYRKQFKFFIYDPFRQFIVMVDASEEGFCSKESFPSHAHRIERL